MSSRKHKPRRLRVESLEKRTMLDGNVTASVVSGVLVVTGDASANGVAISPFTQPDVTGGVSIVPGVFVIQTDVTTTLNNGSVAGILLNASSASTP